MPPASPPSRPWKSSTDRNNRRAKLPDGMVLRNPRTMRPCRTFLSRVMLSVIAISGQTTFTGLPPALADL